MKVLVSILALLVASNVYAGIQEEVSGLTRESAKASIARVQEQITLVQSQKGESDLRVSFLVMDNGGSTDVSPLASLYLTTFNESEMKDAQSVHKLANINSLISTRRVSPGIYTAIVEVYNYSFEVCPNNENYTVKQEITVDARQLTVDVRNFKGVEEFDLGTIQTPVNVTRVCL